MLSLHRIAGAPWAIRQEIALEAHRLFLRDGIAALRHLAELKAAIHTPDIEARRDARARTSGVVAVIPMIGTMTQRGDVIGSERTRSTAALADEVWAAANETSIDATVIEADSPGGEVFGGPEAWGVLREAARLKPLVVSVNSQLASLALWLGSAATEIWITPSGEAGSHGVYAMHVDLSKAMEADGEKVTLIAADESPYKTEGNPYEPLSEDGLAVLKATANRYMGMFTSQMAKGRGLSVGHVQKNFGKGRMLSPEEAVAAKMVDSIGTLEDAIKRAASLARARRANPAAAVPDSNVRAGITSAPNLGQGSMDRSCMNCRYYTKPSAEHDGGACSRHDFHTMDMWVCDDWEAKGGEMMDEGGSAKPAPEDQAARAAAAALLGTL